MSDHLSTPLVHRFMVSPPGIDPGRIYPFGGLDDEMTDYASARAPFDDWGVPQGNRTEWDCGHFGTLLRAIRRDDLRDAIRTALG